jgi:ascorbate-specific PTS system EIIC-type component UlaA
MFIAIAIGIVILLVTNFFTNPAFFMGVFVLIGLLAIKKTWYEALAGFIKTAVGFFILQIGSNGLSTPSVLSFPLSVRSSVWMPLLSIPTS